jgi:hypothetical protein
MPHPNPSGFLPGQESRITEQIAKLLTGGKPLSSPVDTIELSNRYVCLTSTVYYKTRVLKPVLDLMSSPRVRVTSRITRLQPFVFQPLFEKPHLQRG